MKITNRSLHRDFAYFYFGLIVAFSFSGIILNHRQDWYPMDYTYESKEISMQIPEDSAKLEDKAYISELAATWNTESEFDSFRVRENQLRVYYKENTIADIDITTGKGVIEYKRKVPIVGHSMYLHKTTNKAWVWYSDIFGAAMLLIAFTGILIPMGKNGFKARGWKLAIAGMLFPLIFLFFLS